MKGIDGGGRYDVVGVVVVFLLVWMLFNLMAIRFTLGKILEAVQ